MSNAKPSLVLLLPLFFTACALEDDAPKGSGGSAGVAGSGGATSGGATSGSAGGGSGGTGATGGSASGAGGSAGSTAGGGNAGTLGSGGTLAGAAGAAGTSGGAGVAGGAGAGAGGNSGASGSSGAAGMAGAAAGSAGATGSAGSGGAGGAGAAGGGAGGAAAGAAGNAGSAGGTGFSPCPTTGACKILPLGDSITDGFNIAGGYRMKLFSLALADDKDMTFVGGSMNGPSMVDNQPFPRSHEGHSGWTIQQIDGIVPSPALNVAPHIILLHIGTNDLIQGLSGATARLETLVDQIIAGAPDALLAVATVVPYPASENTVDAFNAAVPGIVDERASAGKHVIFVDQFEGFPESELADGIHPNQAGYDRMGTVWYAAISDYLR